MIDLVRDLQTIERQMQALEARKAQLRLELENRTRELGGVANLEGVAELRIMPAAQLTRYDTKALNTLIADMVATGDIDLMEWARRIGAARQTSERASGLRIVWVEKRG